MRRTIAPSEGTGRPRVRHTPRDLPVDRGGRLALPGQVLLAQDLPNDRLDLSRQPLPPGPRWSAPGSGPRPCLAPRATDAARRRPAGARYPTARLRHRRLLPGRPGLGQRADHLRPAHRRRPHLIGDGQQTALRNPVLIDRFVVHRTMQQGTGRARVRSNQSRVAGWDHARSGGIQGFPVVERHSLRPRRGRLPSLAMQILGRGVFPGVRGQPAHVAGLGSAARWCRAGPWSR